MNPTSLAFTLFLGALSALPPLSIDMGLPGIPAIELEFHTQSGQGALTLSLFLAGFALSPLLCGPIADRFGRRRTLIWGLAFFSIAAMGAAFAPSFPTLLAVRLVQGVAAGSCVILPIAIIRDLFEGVQGRHLLSQVTAVLGIAPMAAPVLGGLVMQVGGWRAIYAMQGLAGLILLVVTALWFKESLAPENRRELHPRQLLATYATVLGDRTFVRLTLVYGFGFACMFSYISGSATVLMGEYHLTPTIFSLIFAVTSCGVLIGSLLSGRLSKKHVNSYSIMTAGLLLMLLGVVVLEALSLIGMLTVYVLAPLIALIIFSFGLMAPSANHEALANLGKAAGSAAGVIRCIQMVLGAIASTLNAVAQSFGTPSFVMTTLMAGAVVLSLAIYLLPGRKRLAEAKA